MFFKITSEPQTWIFYEFFRRTLKICYIDSLSYTLQILRILRLRTFIKYFSQPLLINKREFLKTYFFRDPNYP